MFFAIGVRLLNRGSSNAMHMNKGTWNEDFKNESIHSSDSSKNFDGTLLSES